jgi:Flp pilus assembly protein TadD
MPLAATRPKFDRAQGVWAGALLLAGVTALVYLPALRGGFIWDDDTFLTQNRAIKAADGLYRFWFTTQAPDYWPVTYTPLWLEWRLWGLHPFGYHAVNLALHIADSLLLWGVLRRMKIPGAYFAAFIFAVHPVNVETVAWITQRKNLMAMLFALATTWYFLKTEMASPAGTRGNRGGGGAAARGYILSLLAFLLAMLSKGSVAMLPLIFLGLIAWHRRLQLRDWALMLPYFLISGVFVLTDIWFQKHGSHEVFRSAGFLERLLGAGGVIWFYLYKAVLPFDLSFVYPQWHIRVAEALWWLPLLAAIALTGFLWHYRSRFTRPALFAWGYFCLMLFPVLGFTDIQFVQYSLVADHYAHLALVGVVVFVVFLIAPHPGRRITAGILICLLGFLTWRQSHIYRDAETLYRDTLDKNPSCWLADSNLGSILYETGRLPEAIARYEDALRLKPDLFEAQNNLGLALSAAGRLPEAMAHFEEAARIHPGDSVVPFNMAVALAGAGRIPEAIAEDERALRFNPDNAAVRLNLATLENDRGTALGQAGQPEQAAAAFAEASRLQPQSAALHNNLGIVLAQLGRTAAARLQFQEALRLDPHDAEAQANLDRLGALLQDAKNGN